MANRSQVEALQSMISPFMLRRVKEDVAKDIPAKEETVIDVEMTSFQKQYYRAIFEHNHAFLNLGATRQTAPKLMNIQMELRKVCNHPFLLDGVEHRETDRQFREFLESGAFDGTTPEEQQHMLNEHGYIMTSGKSKCSCLVAIVLYALDLPTDTALHLSIVQWCCSISFFPSCARKATRF